MAAADAPDREPEAAHQTVRLDRLERVRRARGREAAGAAGERTEEQLIGLDDHEADAHTWLHHLPHAAQLPERGAKIFFHRSERGVNEGGARDDNEIERLAAVRPGSRRYLAKQFAHAPLGAIARDRAADPARRDDAQPIVIERVRPADDREKPRAHAPATVLDRIELSTNVQARSPRKLQDGPRDRYSDETVRRLRPLARRRLSTIRPFFVCILSRNPCVRRRRRRFG